MNTQTQLPPTKEPAGSLALDPRSLFVWEDTRIGGGSRFGGTLGSIAKSEDEARTNIRRAFEETPMLSGYDDMRRVISSDGTCAWDWLEEDLSKTPVRKTVFLAYGGDY